MEMVLLVEGLLRHYHKNIRHLVAMVKIKVIFVGSLAINKDVGDGETIKNRLFSQRFQELFEKVVLIDTYQWDKHPLVLLKLLLSLFLLIFGYRLVISTCPVSANRLLRISQYLSKFSKQYYWVIGGNLQDYMKAGIVHVNRFASLSGIYVEGNRMKLELEALGLTNVYVVPNAKRIDYIPHVKTQIGDSFKFVFFSRITKAKGCQLIFDAIEKLLQEGYTKFSVTFYGKIDSEYENEFYHSLKLASIAQFGGLLDISLPSSYDVLAKYDVMLFPTIWHGEGFPGTIIDAFVCGMPTIASRWNFNEDLLDEKLGILIPPHDADALYRAMKQCLDERENLKTKYCNIQSRAKEYDIRNVVSLEKLREIRFID